MNPVLDREPEAPRAGRSDRPGARRPRHSAVAVLMVLAAALLVAVVGTASAPPAGAGEDSTTTEAEAPESPSIIPRPNSGQEPDDAGDRGGTLQTIVFVIVVAGVVVIGALVVRESRKARKGRGF